MTPSQAERLARAIAPKDLGCLPLYLVFASQNLPAELLPQGAAGYAGRRLDLALRPWLGKRWEGRGLALVVNDMAIRAEEGLTPDLADQRIMATVCHELAHCLSRPPDLTEATPEAVATQADYLAAWSATTREATPTAPWLGHCGQWLRLLLHVAWRAERSGYSVPLSLAVGWRTLGLTSPWRYRTELAGEPEALASLSFADIRAIQPPQGFADCWRNDVDRWFSTVENPSIESVVCFANALRAFGGSEE